MLGLNIRWRLALITELLQGISSIHTGDEALLSVLMYPRTGIKFVPLL
jgi:hypothetical protein